MNVKIDKKLKTPIYMQIAWQMKHEILSGRINDGSILPSERALAKILGIHRNTVAKAYNELKAEDLIQPRQGVGYIVTMGNDGYFAEKDNISSTVNLKNLNNQKTISNSNQDMNKDMGFNKKKPKKVNWVNQIKSEYMDMEITFDDLFQRFGDEEKYSLGSGLAAVGIYDQKKVAQDITKIITEKGKNQYFYSPYKGDKFLRQKIVSFLSTKGIKATTGEIQILTETNQALDFLVMLLIKAGDTVIMEKPVSPDAYRAMELAGAVIRTAPMDKDGMKCDMLESLVQKYNPKFIYVNSSFHDPTGTILSLERRKKIIEISNTYRVPIIEEDAASELVYRGSKQPPIKAFDTADNVIYIYSFSLTFVPGLSLAFVAADKDVIRSLSYLVSVRMVATDWLSQKLVAKYLGDGTYYGILGDFCDNYGKKQDIICSMLDDMKDLGIEYNRPRGGVYIWCKLPSEIDSKAFIAKAYNKGVALLPGYVFYPDKSGGRDHVRINYSYETEERLVKGLKVFRKTLEEELAYKK